MAKALAWLLLVGAMLAACGVPEGAVRGGEADGAPDRRLFIPAETDEAEALALLAGRADWETVECRGNVGDAFLEALSRCPDLRRVVLFGMNISSQGLEKLAACGQLRLLRILNIRQRLTDGTLAALARGCPEMEELAIKSADGTGTFSADGLLALGAMRKLRLLDLAPASVDQRLPAALANCPGLADVSLWSSFAPLDTPTLTALAAALPALRSFSAFAAPDVGDEAAAAFARNPGLMFLKLDGAGQVTGAGLRALSERSALRGLSLRTAPDLGDGDLIGLAKGCPDLFSLQLGGTEPNRITDEGVAALAGLTRLERLNLSGVAGITDDALERLSRSSVRYLHLAGAPGLTDRGLAALAKFPDLKEATFRDSPQITAKGLALLKTEKPDLHVQSPVNQPHFRTPSFSAAKTLRIPDRCDDAGFKALMGDRTDWEAFECYDGDLSDDWLKALARCPELQAVRINNWRGRPGVTREGLLALAACPKLIRLHIMPLRVPPTDEDLATLVRGCPELRELEFGVLNQSRITAEGMRVIGELKHLERLHVNNSDMNDRFLEILAEHCPNLERLSAWGGNTPFGAPGLMALARLPKLTAVQLAARADVGDEVVTALAANRPGFQSLMLSGSRQVTAAGLAALDDATNLEHLSLGTVPEVGDDALIAFGRKHPGIRTLGIAGAEAATDEALVALGALPELGGLELGNAGRITDEGLARFADAGSKVWTLDLSAAAAVTDKGLAALARLPRINNLYLASAEGITSEGEAEFKKLRPGSHLVTFRNAQQYGRRDNLDAARAAGARPSHTLTIPEDCHEREALLKLMAGRTDWEAIRSESRAFDDAWMAEIAKCPNLLSFSNTFSSPYRLTSAGMALLARCPKLKTLELCSEHLLEDDDLAALARGCPELMDVHICDGKGAAITDRSLSALAQCRNLRKLRIRQVTNDAVTDHVFFTLANDTPDLEELEILAGRLAATDEGLAALGHCPKLRVLRLETPNAGDGALAGLAQCRRLDSLSLKRAAATDAGLAFLRSHPALREIRLSGAKNVTGAGLAALATVATLNDLALPGAAKIGDDDLKPLSGCPDLNRIELGGRDVTDAGVAVLCELRQLFALKLVNAGRITDKGVAMLAERHPELYSLHLNAAKAVTDASLKALARTDHLWDLNLARATGLTDEGMRNFAAHRENLRFTRPKTVAPAAGGKAPEVEVF